MLTRPERSSGLSALKRDCTACADLPSSTDKAGPRRFSAPDSRLREKMSEITRSMTGCD